MKKSFKMLLAIVCCTLLAPTFVSCGDDEDPVEGLTPDYWYYTLKYEVLDTTNIKLRDYYSNSFNFYDATTKNWKSFNLNFGSSFSAKSEQFKTFGITDSVTFKMDKIGEDLPQGANMGYVTEVQFYSVAKQGGFISGGIGYRDTTIVKGGGVVSNVTKHAFKIKTDGVIEYEYIGQ